MNRQLPRVLGPLLGVALLTVASAAPPAIAQTEVNYLLGFIESSGCEFYRNGSWYDSKRAQAHLRYKYQMLAAADQITVKDIGDLRMVPAFLDHGKFSEKVAADSEFHLGVLQTLGAV